MSSTRTCYSSAFQKIDSAAIPAVLVANHGPFAGEQTQEQQPTSGDLESVARMAYFTRGINDKADRLAWIARQALHEKARNERLLRQARKGMMPALACL